tara:strand:+ start:1117 stop:2757 length:1641 start_codon:yes stop_codon:yes gene_type:complete
MQVFNWLPKDLQDFGNYLESSIKSDENNSIAIDLVFVGSGLSSIFTLIEFINKLEQKVAESSLITSNSTIRISVFEKDSCLWGGIPYGPRSGFSSLLITPLDEFLPEFELGPFIKWMKDNIDWLLIPYQESLGNHSKIWLDNFQRKLVSSECEKLHLPRYFFGLYLWNKLRESLIHSSVKIDLKYINSEVISIELNKNREEKFKVITSDNVFYFSKQILLGVGIPKIRSLGINSKIKNDILFLNDPYIPDILSSLENIDNYILEKKSSKVLIVGANASSLELIYHITDLNSFIKNNNITITVISPQGKLPELFVKDKISKFTAENLEILRASEVEVTADLILDNFKKDLQFSVENKFDISDTLPVFTAHVGALLKSLSKEEKYRFCNFHGDEIGRLQRRAGIEYTQSIESLLSSGKLKILKGKFVDFELIRNKTFVKYSTDFEANDKEYFDIVINCAGSLGVIDSGMTPLLRQLYDSGLCKKTKSNRGFIVGDDFEVMKGFYINGPLLAGNVVNDMPIWHVEHCGRIISFAKQISNSLISNFIEQI